MQRLYRPMVRRVPVGVCGEPGDYPDVDQPLLRLAWAVLTLFTRGIWSIACIIALVLVPEEETSAVDPFSPAAGYPEPIIISQP